MANNKRKNTKYPALDPSLNLKTRYELIADYDYLDQLSPKEKEWLNKFTDEYVNDCVDRKNLKNNLHNTQALKKDCDDRNNARNADILTRQKAQNKCVVLDEVTSGACVPNPENKLIEQIDKSTKYEGALVRRRKKRKYLNNASNE